MGVMADVADAIEAAVVPTYPQVQVYHAPEDVTQVPAIVLVPDDPWAEIASFGGAATGTVRWSYQVSIIGHRAAVESSIELMEGLRILIVEGISTLGGRWKMLGKPTTGTLAGIDVLVAMMEIDLLTERQT